MYICFYSILRCKSGTVAVGAALIAPLLILMIAGIIDLGRATYDATSLAGAVRAGTQYALRAPDDEAAIIQVVKEASTLPKTVFIDEQLSSKTFYECPNGNYKPYAEECGTVTSPLRKFIRVSATVNFSKIVPFSSIIVPSTLSAQAIMRLQ
jgi:hypothetical protein